MNSHFHEGIRCVHIVFACGFPLLPQSFSRLLRFPTVRVPCPLFRRRRLLLPHIIFSDLITHSLNRRSHQLSRFQYP
ncbi:hypothetical protein L484_005573 [Morus notabilis]|uniref:Uncharacterized protein n=1 Tax=Morus notabilis TaxID=981085 RepID=W9RI45_9ROSA|nr:hypothetical protein L484_005573 [Morus notabilis]